MRIYGMPLTILIAVASVAISLFLWHMGIFFFFISIIFLPFLRFFGLGRRSMIEHRQQLGEDEFFSSVPPPCKNCGMYSTGNFCPNCGTRMLR